MFSVSDIIYKFQFVELKSPSVHDIQGSISNIMIIVFISFNALNIGY